MIKSEWSVASNYIGGEWLYAVYRLRDITAVDHSGNREYVTDWMENRDEAEAIAERMNRRSRRNEKV